jgi:alkanesulfonate monooxygenase SsuD/methylene tetrahydromethanopterin reductase-like flavin-dependent oxidoreductase (luciferase family)
MTAPAEHHSTPLGCAPSPGLFLAAVAQRTTNLRFGPLVYLLPFYHPLRLIEEICMLDQISGGRFQLGVGRGVSPFETHAYGLEFAQTQGIYHEAFALILKGLASDELTFEGKHFQFRNVPMILRPLQLPHPPLWYGTTIPENADWPAENDVNIVSIALRPTARRIIDRYRTTRASLRKDPAAALLMGIARHVVVADSDVEAQEIARRAYPRWRESFRWLFARHGTEPRHRGIAGHSARILPGGDRGNRGKLSAGLVCIRRHDARGIVALRRAVRARGDAGPAVTSSARA